MRPLLCRLLAVTSVAAFAARVSAVERPHYGGTLRVEMQAAPRAPDPGDAPERLADLLFERLVRLDEHGRPQPALAVSWQSSPGQRRWQFHLRAGVKFHDGTLLTTAVVMAALPASANGWTVGPIADGIVIRSERPLPDLLSELAQPRNAILVRAPGGAVFGTGPFRIAQWESGRRALLSANDDYWDGRPFLDSISVQMGRTPQQQMLDLETGRADLAEISAGEVRRAVQGGMKLWTSAPVSLLALAFEPGRAAEDGRLREALSLSIDRAAIQNVLLQKQGEPAGGLLPEWLSGYAFLFRTTRDIARARQLAAAFPSTAAPLTLGHDAADSLARSIADRIAVNAREAGIRLQVSPQTPKPDLRLARVRIRGIEPSDALAEIASALGIGPLADLSTPETCFAAERALVEDYRVIPLVHLPEIFALRPTVRTWSTPGLLKSGQWRFDDIWLAPERP